jgi:hypothetical protein
MHAMEWITPACAKVIGRAKPDTTIVDVSQLPKSRKELEGSRRGLQCSEV